MSRSPRPGLVLSAVASLVACSTSVKPTEAPGAAGVVLSRDAPPAGYVKVKTLTVVSGKGCGVLGTPGSADEAQALTKSEAAKLGASYVQITSVEKPPLNHQCIEHTHKLSGVAYRKVQPAAAAAPAAKAAATAAPATDEDGRSIESYEGVETAAKPAAPTGRSRVTLSLVPGDGSQQALSVDYSCSGDDQRADLDVWGTPLVADWTKGNALTLRIKPDAPLSLSVSFMDGNHAGYTQKTELLVAGHWQAVRLPFDKFWFNPFGPPGDVKGAPLDRRNVAAFGFAPQGCTNGHFLIDDFSLTE